MWIRAMRPAPDRIIDLYQDWGSARNYWGGLPVYSPHSASIPRHLGLSSNSMSSIEYNAHPPTSVLLALPLARLDYPDAALVWNVISLVALAASLWIVAAELALPWTMLPPTLALLAFCHPVYGNLYLGQLTPILVLFVTATWVLERSGRSNRAGLLLGAAAAIKLFPAYLAVYYLARGRLRPLLCATFSFLALTVVTALVLGLDTYYDYVRVVLPEQAKFRSFGYNISIAGFWHKLFNPVAGTGAVDPLWPSPALARWGTLLSDLAITTIAATLTSRARTLARRDLAFATTVTAMLLVSPVTWDFSLPLLLVPIAVIARGAGTSRLRWMPAALVLILAIDWIPQNVLTELAQAGRSFSVLSWTFMLGAPALKFYALLAIFTLGLTAFRAEKKEAKEEAGSIGRVTGDIALAATSPATPPG
jgi:alpha-1,2-mannosyltransferase